MPLAAVALHSSMPLDETPGLLGPGGRALRCLVMHASGQIPAGLERALSAAQRDTRVQVTRTLAETREALDSAPVDLVLLDRLAADGSVLDLVRELAGKAETCDLPVIVLTDDAAETHAIDVLRAGAADCISTENLSPSDVDTAIENALRCRRPGPADQLAQISNLEAENAVLRRVALRNMRLLKSEALPLLAFAWQAMRERDVTDRENQRQARRLSQITRSMLSLIDDTVITSATHRALDMPMPVDLTGLAKQIVSDDCSEIQLSSAHIRIGELPTLMARESLMSMLFEELFVNMVRNARLGTVPEIVVGSGVDPDGNPILWLTDRGLQLSSRKQALNHRYAALNATGSPNQDGLSWSLCQRLTEKSGGEFKISETAEGHARVSLRFPKKMLAPADAA